MLSVLAVGGDPTAVVAAAPSLRGGFADDVVLSGLRNPTAVRFSPDGRIFIAEKSGLIKVFDSLTDASPDVFADLRTSVHNYWDRGLLGLALDPGFPARPYVYVLYTFDGKIGGAAPVWGTPGATSDACPDPPGATALGCPVSARLSRLQAFGNVMTGAEKVLVHDWFQQFGAHSIGSLTFGPDGALYATGGEGAGWQFVDYGQRENPGGDPPVPVGALQTAPAAEGGSLRSQDLRTTADPAGLNGTVIRIDPATGDAMPDNPLVSRSDVNARRIVAYGLRNPFRMAIRPGTRELWVGDVGWRSWEEINVVADPRSAAVVNFGWPCYEGNVKQSAWAAAGLTLCETLYAVPGSVAPAHFAYRTGVAVAAGETCPNTSASISGLAFYASGNYPARYRGALFFADYSRKCIWAMLPGSNGVPDPATRETFVQDAAYPVDLQTGPGGDLFYVDFTGGALHRIRYQSSGPQAMVEASPASGAVPLTVAFDGSRSSGPGGASLAYSWDLDGDGTFGDATTARPVHTYTAAGVYDATLRVTDADGHSALASRTITAGSSAPVAAIATPAASLRWRVGQSIAFSGQGTDPEQRPLPAAALSWLLIMNHCSAPATCHEHQIQQFEGVAGGSFVAPDHEYPSYLTLRLTATGAGGLQTTVTRRLDPQTVDIRVESEPAGLDLGFGSEVLTAPATRTFIVGSSFTLSAPAPQNLAGAAYQFASWSDGGAQTHVAVAGASAAPYVARFRSLVSSDDGTRVLWASRAPVRAGTWRAVDDVSAAGGVRLEHPDAAIPKIGTAAANPRDFFELTFQADAGRPYRLWFRGRAAGNAYNNDSVYAQFSSTVDAAGRPVLRIGTTDATPLIVEACTGCGVSGWGWEDNGYGGTGPLIRFATTGVHTIRVQGREDGVSIDQIVLSPAGYLHTGPGAAKNDATTLPERPGGTSEIVLHAGAGATIRGDWTVVADESAASGARLENPDRRAAKVATALPSPADYVELAFRADAGRPYRLWLRGRAEDDSYNNDSVYVQFSGSLDAAGAPAFRIGTAEAMAVVLEECGGCGVAGWMWQDTGYGTGVLGPTVVFAESGLQRIRIQRREDGISIDQIVLSPAAYLTTRPGAVRNDQTLLPRTP